MTLRLPTDPDLRNAIQDAREEKNHPNLAIASFAGWKIVHESTIQVRPEEDVWKHRWLAASSVTGRIVTFVTECDEPEPCYEFAADHLVTNILEFVS
jgi:hypothetical protein